MKRLLKKIRNTIIQKYKYSIWFLRTDNKRYYNYYIKRVQEKLQNSTTHPTLGENITDSKTFYETARIEKNLLLKEGLKPSHKVVDYGCGSLRLGNQLIPYLSKGNYIGLDRTDFFFNIGIKNFDDKLIKDKSPSLKVINESTIKKISELQIDYIISMAVLIHIPPKEVFYFFENIVKLMNSNTKAYIDFITANNKIYRYAELTWYYPKSFILKKLNKLGVSCKFLELEGRDKKYYRNGHTIIELQKN
jgi:cyclopropane fatty-acyl-phospholipid synthase-like methyltransferase